MSRKIERLINLTIALLATKRYLTKAEILNTVEGYEGTPETMERMFERDKDDLRSLGIEIEVGSFDPLFSDESGYRIKQEKYELDLGELTPSEMSLLSISANTWQGAALGEAANSALIKLNSMGIGADPIDIPGSLQNLSDNSGELLLITQAISNKQTLFFDYISADNSVINREVIPTSISSRSGFWYLTGVDQSLQEGRTFRLDRIHGSIAAGEVNSDFEPPLDPKDLDPLELPQISSIAVMDVRKGKCRSLRTLSSSQSSHGEWDEIRIPIHNLESLASQILWHGEDVFVREPHQLRELIVEKLSRIVQNHE